jgi:hypothetical protein
MFMPSRVDDTPGDGVQDHDSFRARLGNGCRQDEDRRVKFGNRQLPVPAQPADLLLATSGVDAEQGCVCQVPREQLEKTVLLIP